MMTQFLLSLSPFSASLNSVLMLLQNIFTISEIFLCMQKYFNEKFMYSKKINMKDEGCFM